MNETNCAPCAPRKQPLWRTVLRDTSPVLAGYVVLGFSMGLNAQSKGFSWWIVLLLSLFVYGGTLQFVAADLFLAAMGYWDIALFTLILHSRHIFYGLSLLDRYQNSWVAKPYMILSLTDEAYAIHMTCQPPPDTSIGHYDLMTAGMNHLYWTLGCVVGAIAGGLLPFSLEGLDFALSALFIVTCLEQWREAPTKLPALIGFGVGIALFVTLGKSHFLLPSLVVSVALLMLLRRPIEAVYAKNQPPQNEEDPHAKALAEVEMP